MCKCTPNIRTPFCGKQGCEYPPQKEKEIIYRTTNDKDPWMRLAYLIAKDFYKIHNWNRKTIPVAVIVSPKGDYISHGVCANGMHAVLGHCDRLGEAGTPYHKCIYCDVNQHAEVIAIDNARFQFLGMDITPTQGCTMYIYGHYKSCDTCMQLLKNCGIKEVVFLQGAFTMFDRHHPDTVLGTDKQFII